MLPAPLSSSGQDLAAASGFHSRPEAMRFRALPILWLVSPFWHVVEALQNERLRVRSAMIEYKCPAGNCQGFGPGFPAGQDGLFYSLRESGRCAKISMSKTERLYAVCSALPPGWKWSKTVGGRP